MTQPDPVDVPPAVRSDVLCAPWATPADIPEPFRPLGSDEEWEEVLLQASEILYYLSGRRFIGGGCTETAILRAHPPGPGEGSWPYHQTWGACPCWLRASIIDGWLSPFDSWTGRHYGQFAIRLPRAPVTAVTAVLQNGLPFTDFRVGRNGYLERTDGKPWQMCDDSTQIVYTFGDAPPEGGVRAAVRLAIEFMRSRNAPDDCQLPERVQSITRQGITVAVLDPQDFLTEGRVGLYEVDLWLAAVNPLSRPQRARVFSPDVTTAFIP